MFRTVPPVLHQEFFTVHTAIGMCHTCLLTICEQDQDGSFLILLASCMAYTIAVCAVKNS